MPRLSQPDHEATKLKFAFLSGAADRIFPGIVEADKNSPQHGPIVSALLGIESFLVATVALILKVTLYIAIGVIVFLRIMTKNPNRG